ncbi:hypothetical protein BJY01DRAFT_255700 [Aspergillus pseudoustus]|uniref:Ankyrin repeat-containing domain protein n=1 Tax=Aspergillus pseudoustus TaxID=1810923 RepID=A0ABR4II97_9EURO
MDMVRLLWAYGSLLLWRSGTELHAALACGVTRRDVEAARTILACGLRVNARCAHHNITPLELAVEMGEVELVEVLLGAGARGRYGWPARGCAIVRGVQSRDERIATLVIGSSTCMQKTMALCFAAEQEDGHFVRFLLARGTYPEFDALEYSDAHPAESYTTWVAFLRPLRTR